MLEGLSDPAVWRRLKVPSNLAFLKFHEAIQRAFGWENYHLFAFMPKPGANFEIGPSLEEEIVPTLDANTHHVSDFIQEIGQTFYYHYDFGDDWMHRIVLEEITDEKGTKVTCLAGGGKCPPEDCGGFPGYLELLKAINHPRSAAGKRYRGWLGLNPGERWDPSEFDLEKTNARLRSRRF